MTLYYAGTTWWSGASTPNFGPRNMSFDYKYWQIPTLSREGGSGAFHWYPQEFQIAMAWVCKTNSQWAEQSKHFTWHWHCSIHLCILPQSGPTAHDGEHALVCSKPDVGGSRPSQVLARSSIPRPEEVWHGNRITWRIIINIEVINILVSCTTFGIVATEWQPQSLCVYHRRRKGGARGARAPPIFFRGVQSTPNNSMHTLSLKCEDASRMNMNVCWYANNYN